MLTLTLVSGVWMPASAEGAVVPFYVYYPVRATVVYEPPPCNCLHQTYKGVGEATHLGLSEFYSNATSNMPNLTQYGSGEITAANGDKLFIEYTGGGVYTPGHGVDFGGTYEITGGTGRFAGVTGEGEYWGYAYFMVPNPENKPNDLFFEGVLYK
jgi:hypothetical protein